MRSGARCEVWETDTLGYESNAAGRANAQLVTIGDADTTAVGIASIVNTATTTTTTSTSLPTSTVPNTSVPTPTSDPAVGPPTIPPPLGTGLPETGSEVRDVVLVATAVVLVATAVVLIGLIAALAARRRRREPTS